MISRVIPFPPRSGFRARSPRTGFRPARPCPWNEPQASALRRRRARPRNTLPPRDRRGGAQRDLAADGALEVRALPERRLRAGRGDVDRVVVQIVAEHIGDALAERVVDALGMVDEDGEALGAGELDRQDLDSGQAALDARGDLAVEAPFLVVDDPATSTPLKKNGRGAPISNCPKCGATRIARGLQNGGTGPAPRTGLAVSPGRGVS